MADTTGPVASAIVSPDAEARVDAEAEAPEAPKSPKAPLKRRLSSASDSDSTSKRPKCSPDAPLRDFSQPIQSVRKEPEVKSEDALQKRRKSSVQEEKRRGQRLFGGLLSTLSQSTPNGQQKRRLDIEKRQQEKAKQQKAADEARRREKLADLKTVRKAEQIIYDEAEMRTRHSNLIAMAHFLYTASEPRIYYSPWKLLSRDEERIRTQIKEAEATIDRETSQFKLRYPDRSRRRSEQNKDENQVQEEHTGEVVVENDEDTVIY
ncbi:uncharacterized protein L3040_007068 [Drepanopeziza brunnea f. sp. 'multigermtubi']|uniref:uncharacterized protein n=1 Tax=Drepanopeziza brunnea f. sp. 'multigermtubi' TaxID=698441 RepID=UPI00238FF208|nr:hypothetical protein L3040_007068 [Drepanopeziza brunnea f. sp. 'multigermtubi']